METLTNLDVSLEVMEAAEAYADKYEGWLTPAWLVRYNSFLAGAFYSKPSEHKQHEPNTVKLNGHEQKQSNEGNEI